MSNNKDEVKIKKVLIEPTQNGFVITIDMSNWKDYRFVANDLSEVVNCLKLLDWGNKTGCNLATFNDRLKRN